MLPKGKQLLPHIRHPPCYSQTSEYVLNTTIRTQTQIKYTKGPKYTNICIQTIKMSLQKKIDKILDDSDSVKLVGKIMLLLFS